MGPTASRPIVSWAAAGLPRTSIAMAMISERSIMFPQRCGTNIAGAFRRTIAPHIARKAKGRPVSRPPSPVSRLWSVLRRVVFDHEVRFHARGVRNVRQRRQADELGRAGLLV